VSANAVAVRERPQRQDQEEPRRLPGTTGRDPRPTRFRSTEVSAHPYAGLLAHVKVELRQADLAAGLLRREVMPQVEDREQQRVEARELAAPR